jgi:hypothetical protein
MLPTAHVEFTWAAANGLQRLSSDPRWKDVDYRLLALAAVLPDLIDKPLAVFAFPDSHAALLYGHTLLFHAVLWAATAATGRMRRGLPYLMALSGHLVADRIWGFPRTLLWPLRGRQFHEWKDVGSPQAFVQAYVDIIRDEPKLLAFEAVGLVLLAWVIADRRLYRGRRLRRLLHTGKVTSDNGD